MTRAWKRKKRLAAQDARLSDGTSPKWNCWNEIKMIKNLGQKITKRKWDATLRTSVFTRTCTHTWCYATHVVTCTCAKYTWYPATDVFTCTCIHTWCYATDMRWHDHATCKYNGFVAVTVKNNRDTQNAKKKINTCVLLQRNTNTFKFGHPKKQSFVKQTEDGTEAKTRFSQKHSGIAKERNTQTIKNATACGLCTWRKHQHWHFFWNAGPKLGLFGCFCSAGWELVKDCSSSAPFRIFQGLSSWTMETAKSRALALHDGMSTWNLVSLDEFLCALYETICLTYFVAKLEVQLLAAHMNPCRVGLQCQVRRGGNNRCQISMETDWCSFCQKSCYNHYRHAWPHRL